MIYCLLIQNQDLIIVDLQYVWYLRHDLESLNDETESIKQSFQDGVDTLYNACVSAGQTPTDKSPSSIANAIQQIKDNASVATITFRGNLSNTVYYQQTSSFGYCHNNNIYTYRVYVSGFKKANVSWWSFIGGFTFRLFKGSDQIYNDNPLSVGLDRNEHSGSKEYILSSYDYDRIEVRTTGSSNTNAQDGHASMILS